MNITLWFVQVLIAFAFLYSGFCKSFFSISKLVSMGQTGVQNLSLWFVRFIGITEVLGAIGIVLPWAIGVYPVLTPISAFCFAFIMPFAAVIHHKLGEPKNVATNIIFFCICMFIGIMRMMNV